MDADQSATVVRDLTVTRIENQRDAPPSRRISEISSRRSRIRRSKSSQYGPVSFTKRSSSHLRTLWLRRSLTSDDRLDRSSDTDEPSHASNRLSGLVERPYAGCLDVEVPFGSAAPFGCRVTHPGRHIPLPFQPL